jgi:RNA polymerase sigma-70 factor (ECF subfamily)
MAQADTTGDTSDELRWATLMASAQKGSESDYRQLLKELSEAIKYYLLSRFGSQHFVEDCVQESLIAIHQARHSYDPRRRFRPWLFAIVRHKAIDSLRRQRSHDNLVQQSRQVQPDEAGRDPTRDVENEITQGRLMASLSREYREALVLTKIIGLSNAEAARRLSITEGAVKVRVHRAVGSLAKMLEAEA